LNNEVNKINYGLGEAKVYATDLENSEKVEYSADTIACTVSIGVL